MELGNEKMHQIGNLLLAPFPILRRECIECDKPNALFGCLTDDPLDSLQAF
jgi:hypothetical protein